ncbi:MAG: hypothetical protein K1X72_24800 [Pyrinomonadaceae bacterium]|nr:hypothetical protein [Pyrinomonadaceae bacterium]
MELLSDFSCQYIINSDDEIVFVNEDWQNFAVAANASNLLSDKILQQSIWNFITDLSTIYLYREILKKVRTGDPIKFNIRCDSAEFKRLIEINISPQPNDGVHFENRILKMEKRSPQDIFKIDIPRSNKIVVICSWCNRINLEKNKWVEIESAVKDSEIFSQELLPQLSHGMCQDCFEKISRQIDSVI